MGIMDRRVICTYHVEQLSAVVSACEEGHWLSIEHVLVRVQKSKLDNFIGCEALVNAFFVL